VIDHSSDASFHDFKHSVYVCTTATAVIAFIFRSAEW